MNLFRALVFVVATCVAAGCSEKRPRDDPERGHSYNRAPQNQLHERALTQGEAERIGN